MIDKKAKAKKPGSHLARKSLALFLRSLRGIAGFEILFKLCAYFILFPLISKVESLVLLTSGVSYITMQNARTVLLNPLSWIVLFFVMTLVFFFTSIELLGLFRAIHAAASGASLRTREILHEGIRCTYDAIRSRSLLYPVFVLLLIPATNIIAATTLTRHLSMPGFILSWIQERPYVNLVYILLCVALSVLALMLMYVPSAMTTQFMPFKKASEQSMLFSNKHRIRTFFSLLLWELFVFILMMLLVLVVLAAVLLIGFWLDPASFRLSGALFETILGIEVFVLVILSAWVASPIAFTRLHAGFLYEAQQKGIDIPPFTPSLPFARQKLVNRILIAAVLICGFFFVPPRYRLIRFTVLSGDHPTLVMAHRGDSAHAPENTIPAFQSAFDNGADAIELDVQMTKDGEIVVMHDSSLGRTTGLQKDIWDVTWDEIRELDNGSFFSPEFAGTRIPTLEEVLHFGHAHNDIYLNIEIKRTGHDDGIEKKVIDLILQNDYSDHCDITSLDYATLEAVRDINPAIRTAYTTVLGAGNVQGLDAADIFSLESISATGDFIQYLNKLGKGVFVWTLNTEEELSQMVDFGVDAVLTDDVALARGIVDENVGTAGLFARINRLLVRL